MKKTFEKIPLVFIFPFLFIFIYLMYAIIIPRIIPLFGSSWNSGSFFGFVILLSFICTAGLIAIGGSLFFFEVFYMKTHKSILNLFTGVFSLISFFLVFIRLPNDIAVNATLFTIPITSFLILISISTWIYLKRSFSKRLILSFGAVIFFFNYINLLFFVNRFHYFKRGWGWNMFASAIVLDLIFIVSNYFFISKFLEKKRGN